MLELKNLKYLLASLYMTGLLQSRPALAESASPATPPTPTKAAPVAAPATPVAASPSTAVNKEKARSKHRSKPASELAFTADRKHTFQKACEVPDPALYIYGVGGMGCDAQANQYGDADYTQKVYKDYIYDNRLSGDEQNKKYLTYVYNLIREISTDFYKKNHPQASDAEVGFFVRGMLAMGEIESVFSQYRIAKDNRFKLDVGDHGRSHGMMQINQYYNYSRNPDNSLDLVGNISFGVSFIHQKFLQTADATCVIRVEKSKKSSLENVMAARLRTAYAFYNGGNGCSWVHNNKHGVPKMARDRNYWDHYSKQNWLNYVANTSVKPNLNIDCILNNDRVCSLAKPAGPQDSFVPQPKQPIVYDDGTTCMLAKDGSRLICTDDSRSFVCATGADVNLLHNKPVAMKKRDPKFPFEMLTDRAAICEQFVQGLLPIGGFVRLNGDYSMRFDLAGAPQVKIPAGTILQILDFDVVETTSGPIISYRVSFNNQEGFFTATFGNKLNGLVTPATLDEIKTAPKLIPYKGAEIEITKSGWIAAHTEASETSPSPGVFKNGQKVVVQDVIYKNASNDIYVQVTLDKRPVYIYAGHTSPSLTVNKWVDFVKGSGK